VVFRARREAVELDFDALGSDFEHLLRRAGVVE
jgi:RNase P protein component